MSTGKLLPAALRASPFTERIASLTPMMLSNV
jgi:hypothetical protein